MRVRPYGAAALLAEPSDAAIVPALAERLRREPDVLEVVPGACTLLVHGEPARLRRLAERLPALEADADASTTPNAELVELRVRYDGADLGDTAAELGLDTDELVRRHAAGDYVVAFCGFAPGFAYLRGLDPALHVARLAEPRAPGPAGAVGIAGEFTGVYPRPSPGGWRLLGTTDAPLWDLQRTPPALLAPGTRVRFVPT